MQANTLQLNIITANPALGLAFTYPWVGVDTIQNPVTLFLESVVNK